MSSSLSAPRLRRTSGSVLEERTLKCQSVVVDRDAVQLRDLAVGEARLEARAERPSASSTVELISPLMKYLRAQRLEQLGHRGALLRQQVEDEQRRDEARVGVVVVAEVVVARDLAAEQHGLAAHALLEEGVPDAVEQRARRRWRVIMSGTARLARRS